MKKIAVSLLAGAALVALTAAPAAAQNSELGGGFANQTWNGCCAYGFGVDFAQALTTTDTRSTAIVVDFGRTRFTDEETDTTVVGGVRFKFLRDRKVAVFVQGTAGLVNWNEDAFGPFPGDSGTMFMVGGGGGIQIMLTEMIDLKVQMDLWMARDSDFADWDRITRVLFGAVFKFGAK